MEEKVKEKGQVRKIVKWNQGFKKILMEMNSVYVDNNLDADSVMVLGEKFSQLLESIVQTIKINKIDKSFNERRDALELSMIQHDVEDTTIIDTINNFVKMYSKDV